MWGSGGYSAKIGTRRIRYGTICTWWAVWRATAPVPLRWRARVCASQLLIIFPVTVFCADWCPKIYKKSRESKGSRDKCPTRETPEAFSVAFPRLHDQQWTREPWRYLMAAKVKIKHPVCWMFEKKGGKDRASAAGSATRKMKPESVTSVTSVTSIIITRHFRTHTTAHVVELPMTSPLV